MLGAQAISPEAQKHIDAARAAALADLGDYDAALESFAEYGSWDLRFLQWGVARRLDRERKAVAKMSAIEFHPQAVVLVPKP